MTLVSSVSTPSMVRMAPLIKGLGYILIFLMFPVERGFVILVIGFRRILWRPVEEVTSNYIYNKV